MMDMLQISALSTKTRIGVYAWEQRILQSVLLDIRIPVDVSTCNNDIENTIDYDKLCQCVTTFVESNSFTLIETVAESVAALIKNEFNIKELIVSVSKPHAVKNAGNISITISR